MVSHVAGSDCGVEVEDYSAIGGGREGECEVSGGSSEVEGGSEAGISLQGDLC